MMPPPSLSSSDTAKRGHASRRSLNSLVGSKPWSSLLGSPHMGGGLALGSSSSHRKRVSTMAISRPMSVSTSAFSTDATDLSPDRLADLTLRPSDFEGARSRLRVDSTLSNFSEPSQWEPPSGPLGVALTPHAATAESSASSHHSHHSHRSHRSFQSHRLAPTSSNSALRQPTLGQASRPTTGEGFSLDHYSSPSLAAISAHLDDPPSLKPLLFAQRAEQRPHHRLFGLCTDLGCGCAHLDAPYTAAAFLGICAGPSKAPLLRPRHRACRPFGL